MDSLSTSDSVVAPHPPPPDDHSKTGVVLPHPSPQRSTRGSFLGQKLSPRPSGSATPPRSPAAQDMEEILARSRGHSGRGLGGKCISLSARRRLSLNSDQVCCVCLCVCESLSVCVCVCAVRVSVCVCVTSVDGYWLCVCVSIVEPLSGHQCSR